MTFDQSAADLQRQDRHEESCCCKYRGPSDSCSFPFTLLGRFHLRNLVNNNTITQIGNQSQVTDRVTGFFSRLFMDSPVDIALLRQFQFERVLDDGMVHKYFELIRLVNGLTRSFDPLHPRIGISPKAIRRRTDICSCSYLLTKNSYLSRCLRFIDPGIFGKCYSNRS